MGNNKLPALLKGSSAADLAKLLGKMNLQLNKKIEELHGDCEDEKNKLKDLFASAMVKIPKPVKQMSVGQFNSIYKCDILALVNQSSEAAAAGKKRDRFETPANQSARQRITTPSRTVRKGETL